MEDKTAEHLVTAIESPLQPKYAPTDPPVYIGHEPVASSGAELIAAERKRQIENEGFTPAHDLRYNRGELLLAGKCYANVPALWPWSSAWWKPSDDPVKNLVKAGALIAAEIDRLLRQTGTDTNAPRDGGGEG